MAIEQTENYAILLEDDTVVLRCETVRERLVMTSDSAKYPLEMFLKNYPNVPIRGYTEDAEPDYGKVPVAKLANVLMHIKDRAVVKKAMMDDSRSTAKQHYIKRLEALGDNTGDAGQADGDA